MNSLLSILMTGLVQIEVGPMLTI